MVEWKKERKVGMEKTKKKRTNYNLNLRLSLLKLTKPKKVKKSLQYLLLIKKFEHIDYKNIQLLKAFLTKYGKIRARRKTRLPVQKQRRIAKAIRKARAYRLLPFVCDVIV